MKELEELRKNFDLDALEKQFEEVVESRDPVSYLENNINWEIDNDTDANLELEGLSNALRTEYAIKGYGALNPFRKFLDWFKRNKVAQKIKGILCSIADKIQNEIDAKAELKSILRIALVAVVTALGMAYINPLVLTIVVGILATMILSGVNKACKI